MKNAGTSNSAALLFDLLSNHTLTNGQTNAVIELGQFLDSDNHDVFLLRGYAGTGKTFLIDALVKMLRAQGRTAVLSAPTGRAARIIREKTRENAFTIHGMIYNFDSIEEQKIEGVEGSETYKLIVSLSVNDEPNNTVYITDEASLVSDQFSEAEFFQCGSGHVLRDLMHFINFDNNTHRKKLILIGDDAQLPPVGMSFSPALSPNYLTGNFGVRVRGYELTDVVRQKTDSGVLKAVHPLRESLKAGVFNKLSFDTELADVHKIEMGEAVSTYLDSCDHRVSNKSVIITRSNADAGMFNRSIRERLFPSQPEAAPGDKLMVVKNTTVDGIRIANGDFALVRSVSNERKIRHITIRRKNEETSKVEEIPVKLSFREATLGLRMIDGSAVFITTNIIENLLYEDRPTLTSDEHKALYVDFCQRHADLRKDREAFSQALLADRYFNALRVKFGYALTCHKAQGSEWENAVVSCASLSNPLSSDNFRWLYTALTRAKSRLFLIDPPRIEVGSGIKAAGLGLGVLAAPPHWQALATPDSARQVAATEVPRPSSPSGASSGAVDLRQVIRHRVTEILDRTGIEIEGVEHNQYQEAYFFRREGSQARLNIYYKGSGKITRVMSAEGGDLSTELVAALSTMIGSNCAASPPATAANNAAMPGSSALAFSQPFLEEFHHKLLSLTQVRGIEIAGLHQKQWFQRYSFQRGTERAEVDIYYNRKQTFRKCQPVGHVITPTPLLQEVLGILTIEMNE